MLSWLVLLALAIYGIATVHSQFGGGGGECDAYTCPTPDCSQDVAETYICTETTYGGDACVEYANKCLACTRACEEVNQWLTASTVYTIMQCGLGACPTPAPIVPGTPTTPPTPAPTLACDAYDCSLSTGCDGQPAEAYQCGLSGTLQGYECTDHANQCEACCEALTLSNDYLQGVASQDWMYNNYCGLGSCPTTAAPSISPTLRPSQSPLVPGQSHSPSATPTENPSENPSSSPVASPSSSPTTAEPSTAPISQPSQSPLAPGQTRDPSPGPSENPTENPSKNPTESPTTDEEEPSQAGMVRVTQVLVMWTLFLQVFVL